MNNIIQVKVFFIVFRVNRSVPQGRERERESEKESKKKNKEKHENCIKNFHIVSQI